MKIYLPAILVTFLVAAGLVGAFAYWREATAPKEAEQRVLTLESMEKEGLPDFEGKTLQGSTIHLQDFKGKIVVLNFWASWCGPCVEEFPSLLKLVKEMKGQMVLVAVSGDSSREDIDQFLIHLDGWDDPNVHIIWDESRAIEKQYDVERLPESYVANTRLQLAKKIVGSVDWYTPDSIQYMQEVLRK